MRTADIEVGEEISVNYISVEGRYDITARLQDNLTHLNFLFEQLIDGMAHYM